MWHKFASNASSPYLLAISKSNTNEETIWVAFRVTANIDDLITDLTIIPALTSSGMVHQGFSKRAANFPYDTLINEFNSTNINRKRLIFTGHSLGGSVAHLCALFNLANKSFKENPQIYSIAFGAPFVGNITVAKEVIKNNFNKHFLTIINQSDMVPNLLNLVETAARIQKTVAPVIEVCAEVAKTLVPLVSFPFDIPQKVIETSVSALNSWIPKLKSLLVNQITEYRPIGQYGFIRAVLSSNSTENHSSFDWIITYKSNSIKKEQEENEKFIDTISRKLIESFGPSTATITDQHIIHHYMEKYISSLKSCEIIRLQSSNHVRDNQNIFELTRFNPHIKRATAVCCDTDIKITIVGDHLDFLSLHKKMCIITSDNFFQPSSVITTSEISRNKLILMNNSLIPTKNRMTIGPRKYQLDTHFGTIDFELALCDDNNCEQQTTTFQIFDVNFLMGAFLRSFFECLHSHNDLFLTNKNTTLYYLTKLVENRLLNEFGRFKSLLEKHFYHCQEMKKMKKAISIDEKFYNDLSGLISELYRHLTSPPDYKYDSSFLKRAKENPGQLLLYGAGALVGTYILIHGGLFGIVGYQLFAGTTLSTIIAELGVLDLAVTAVGTGVCYDNLVNVGRISLSRLVYHEHLAFLVNSMGRNSDNCANERMLEIELCDILKSKSINFDDIDVKNDKSIETIIKKKNLFNTNETTNSERPTLYGTVIESQIKAFKFLHDIYYINKLRQSMSAQYISFIGAHRAGKSSLLKSLWNIPAPRGDHLNTRTQQIQMYTLYDDKSSNKVHILDHPGVTDPVQTIAHLNKNYCVLSTFYVIVVKAGTDYNSAAQLIKELQASSTATNANTCTVDNEQQLYGLNRSAKFVVIITGIDTIPDSLIENELNEAADTRLKIDKELICLCYNKEAISDQSYVQLHESRNLPGISEVRKFLNQHINQIIDKHSDFINYTYREQ